MNETGNIGARAGVVTTLRGADNVIESFIRYHLAAGFVRLYLFFDDPADPALETARRIGDPRVTIIVNDALLEAEWQRCVQFGHYAPHVRSEVMARQCLNVEVAVQRSQGDGLEWLLHIDIDELFHCPGQSVPAHFGHLTRAGVERAVYPNLEALPETETVGDYFREVTLFKANRNLLTGGRFVTAQQTLADNAGFPPHFFLFYSNGKSAARVRPGLVPDGVHRFHAKRYPRIGQSIVPAPAGREHVIGDAVILHYACCGFDNFRDKYRMLGAFADRWFGNVDIRASIGDFHLGGRDVVASGDDEAARLFYRRHAMLDDKAAIEALIGARMLTRIEAPADFLNGRTARLG
jgi:hypothetical protein